MGDQKSMPGFEERCESSKSDVIYFCPKKDLPIDSKYRTIAMALNKKFKDYLHPKSTKQMLKRKRKQKKRRKSKRNKNRDSNKRKGKKRLRKKRTRRKRKKRRKQIAYIK